MKKWEHPVLLRVCGRSQGTHTDPGQDPPTTAPGAPATPRVSLGNNQDTNSGCFTASVARALRPSYTGAVMTHDLSTQTLSSEPSEAELVPWQRKHRRHPRGAQGAGTRVRRSSTRTPAKATPEGFLVQKLQKVEEVQESKEPAPSTAYRIHPTLKAFIYRHWRQV